jgi:hypothetical protein
LVRRYLAKNNFRLVTKTTDGEPLHYTNECTARPKYKMPDHVAVKGNIALVLEDKKRYCDLFRDGMSDIKKLSMFFSNENAKARFKKLLQRLKPSMTKPKIVCGFASFAPAKYSNKIPEDFIFIEIQQKKQGFVVKLIQNANIDHLFEQKEVELTL